MVYSLIEGNHPQMIKGLINIMNLKPGDTVLDPMMGSGTVLIEARLMGIKSIGIDASPFCRFMVQAKLDGLTVPLAPVRAALANCKSVFEHFKARVGHPKQGSKMRFVGYSGGDGIAKLLERCGQPLYTQTVGVDIVKRRGFEGKRLVEKWFYENPYGSINKIRTYTIVSGIIVKIE